MIGGVPKEGDIDISIRRPKNGASAHGKDEPREKDSDRLSGLFSRLGGEGKVRVKRILPDGTESYVARMKMDDSLADEIEERIGKAFGGGVYKLEAYDSGRVKGSAEINIDERAFGPAKNLATAESAAPAAPVARDSSEMSMRELFVYLEQQNRQAQQEADRRAQVAHQQQQAMMMTMLQLQENAAQRQAEVFMRVSTAQAPSAAGLGLGQIVDVMQTFQKVKELVGAPSESMLDHSSFGEKVLLGPLKSMADKIGEKVGDAIVKNQLPAPAAAPAPPPPLTLPRPAPGPIDRFEPPAASPGGTHARRGLPPGVQLLKPAPAKPPVRPAPVAPAAPDARQAPRVDRVLVPEKK